MADVPAQVSVEVNAPAAHSVPQRYRSSRGLVVRLAIALIFAIVIGGYQIHTMRGTTFYSDEWTALSAYSWSPHILLRPQAGHNFYFSTILWNGTMALFGAKSYLPFRVLGLLCNLFTATALFAYGWRRLSFGMGLLLGVVVLTMGSSFQTLLWPTAALGVLSVGVLAFSFLLLEHPSRWGGILIVFMLVAMVGAGAYGLLAVFGVFVEIALRRQWRLLWIPAIPSVLYLAWRVAYHAGLSTAGASGVGRVPLVNFTGATSYIAQQLSASVAGLSGQVATMGAALTVGLIALIAWMSKKGEVDRVRMASLAGVAVFFWLLLAIVRGQDAEFGAPRYVAFGALPIALIILEAIRSQPRSRTFTLTVVAASCFCILANFNQLEVAGGDFRYLSMLDLPAQTALQLSAPYVSPTFTPANGLATSLVAGPYLKVVHSFGSNAPSPAQLTTLPEAGRSMADSVLVAAGAIHFSTASTAIECGTPSAADTFSLPPGRTATIRVITGPTVVSARRFADDDPSQPLDTISAPGTTMVTTEPDARNFSSNVPWKFSVDGGRFEICR